MASLSKPSPIDWRSWFDRKSTKYASLYTLHGNSSVGDSIDDGHNNGEGLLEKNGIPRNYRYQEPWWEEDHCADGRPYDAVHCVCHCFLRGSEPKKQERKRARVAHLYVDLVLSSRFFQTG